DDGRLETLLTAPYSFPGAPLSGIYGLDATAAGAQGAKVALPPERSGVLTHPSVLAATSHSDQTSLVKRGVFLLQNVLCYEITFPVGLEIPSLPDPDPTKTTRERFAEHEASPVCGTCHKVIDPLGFVFERYDPVGALRDTENGKPVDDTGTVEVGDPVADGFTRGAVELTRKLATSPMVRSCMVKQWHRFALGRAEGKADEGTLAALESEFADSGYNLRALVLGLVTQDSFRLKSPEAR
ncbi:MAG TPA: DUF1588 domain-containing protein, partial [Myxococcaceae bacterium]|nr:DUF1588 domain-containing protein [Myxococcaceae bacterium]